MRLEKRILQLEKQVLLLKAKIKANDLWKQEIQSWIYKTFKRSIVEKLVGSDSGEDSYSENELSEDADQGSDMDVGYFPVHKKTRRAAKSLNVVKRKRPRIVAAVATSSNRKETPVSNRSTDGDVVAVALSKTRIRSGSESSPAGEGRQLNTRRSVQDSGRTSHDTSRTSQDISRIAYETSRSSQDTSRSIQDTSRSAENSSASIQDISVNLGDDIESDAPLFDEVEVDEAIVNVRVAENSPDLLKGENSRISEDHQSSKVVKLKSSTRGKIKGLVEIRPDLKKYFEYWPIPEKPGEYKLACLIEGCNSKLSMHPSNRWANSARHLGGAHQIREYMPASSLASSK